MKNVKCRNCIEYRNDWCHKVCDDPYPDIVRDCQYYREKTNADHIRAMTNAELAEIIMCPYDGDSDLCIEDGKKCIGCCVEWLNMPWREKDSLAKNERQKTSAWISVEDRLPEPFVSVLVYMPGEKPLPTVHEGYFVRDTNKWYSHFFDRGLDEVTHWMPMPEPPEEG